MGRAFHLDAVTPTVTYFLDHFTHDRILRAMTNLGMIQDLEILDLARMALHRAFPGEQPPAAGPNATAAAIEALRAVGVAEPAGIPRHKLATAEGWLITPAEITAALDAYQRAPFDDCAATGDRIDDWQPWIDFLHLAGDHNGLRCT
ncbi:hypothetical protein ACIQ9P_03730 [Kitasatospora sp. NPDC094019]|uniref:hypothetical protein n=1 Tax=Kitasatospora sp. NPDC094019 TaxID=3364091 RepID=UPI00381E672E